MTSFLVHSMLACVDCFLVLFVMFPLALFHWRGTWDLLDAYIFPNDLFHSSWTTLAIGSNSCLLGYMIQPTLAKLAKQNGKVTYIIASRFYMYLIGWAIMCFWRGFWNLCDLYLTEEWWNSLVTYCIAQILTLITMTSRTNCGLPMALTVDTDPDLLMPVTRFDTDLTKNVGLYLVDLVFTQFIVVVLNITVWRGIWNIIDAFLFPHHHVWSDLSSLVIGYGMTIFLFIFQYPASLASKRLDKKWGLKVLFEDILFIIGTWATLFLWRGGWNLCVAYVLPGQIMGAWVCHAVGTVGLMLFQGFSNVGTNGTDLDGYYSNGEGIYPLDYIRAFVREGKHHEVQLEDKEHLLSETDSISDDIQETKLPLEANGNISISITKS